MTRTEKLLIVLSFIGCVTVISIVLKFADKIDAMGEKPTTCEVWLHAKPLETHVWKGELK